MKQFRNTRIRHIRFKIKSSMILMKYVKRLNKILEILVM